MSNTDTLKVAMRWKEGFMMLVALFAGVALLQAILPSLVTLQAVLLALYAFTCVTLLYQNKSIPTEVANKDMPQYQFDYEAEFKRAYLDRHVDKRPLRVNSPEDIYIRVSRGYLIAFVRDTLLLGLIVTVARDPRFEALSFFCGVFVLTSALEKIWGYAYTAQVLWSRPAKQPTRLHTLILWVSCAFGLLYCFFAGLKMLGLV